jgi:GT2 family glycosyltransferase
LDWGLSNDIAGARNLLVKRSLEVGSEWILFIDDDHVYPDDLLIRLLSHDKDMVCSLYLARQQPFAPVAYSHREDNAYIPLILPNLPETGLIPIHAAGASGMLIRSELFRAIEYPWFEHGRVGELWNASEDLIFCEKAHDAGFEIWLDLEARLGHMTPSAIWPSWIDQEWTVGFSVADGLRLYCPIESPAEAPAPADAVGR